MEKAVNFYVDYLEMQDSQSLLPTALLAALDGRLGRLEDLIARREFNRYTYSWICSSGSSRMRWR